MTVTRNTALNVAGQIVPLLVGLAALPVIVRGLGPDRLGLLGLGWVVLGYFTLLDLGIGRAAARFTATALSRGDQRGAAATIWSAVLLQGFMGGVGAALMFGFAPFLALGVLDVAPALQQEAIHTFRILALAIPIVLVSASFRGGLEASRRFDLVQAVAAPASALNYLVPLVGVLMGTGLAQILWGLVAVRAAALAAFAYLGARQIPELFRSFGPDRATFRGLAGFGLWASVSGIASPLLDQLDRFLLGAFAGLTAVGHYTAPQELVWRTRILPSALGSSLFPEFSGDKPGSRVPHLYSAAVRSLAGVLAPIAVVLVFLARDLLAVWLGEPVALASGPALQWLAIGAVFNAVAYVPNAYLYGINRPDLPAKFHLMELPAFLVLCAVLMPRWGATGAGAGWAIRAAVDAGLLLAAASRCGATTGVRIIRPAMMGWVVLTTATLAVGFLVSSAGLGMATRALAALAGVAAVSAGGWFGLLEESDRAALARAVTSRQPR